MASAGVVSAGSSKGSLYVTTATRSPSAAQLPAGNARWIATVGVPSAPATCVNPLSG
jgi:hypothetical protein